VRLNLQELKLLRHPLGYYQLTGKFRDIVPMPVDEGLRTHCRFDMNGISVQLYQTGFQVLVLRDHQVARLGEIIEMAARRKPFSTAEKICKIVKAAGHAVVEDIEQTERIWE